MALKTQTTIIHIHKTLHPLVIFSKSLLIYHFCFWVFSFVIENQQSLICFKTLNNNLLCNLKKLLDIPKHSTMRDHDTGCKKAPTENMSCLKIWEKICHEGFYEQLECTTEMNATLTGTEDEPVLPLSGEAVQQPLPNMSCLSRRKTLPTWTVSGAGTILKKRSCGWVRSYWVYGWSVLRQWGWSSRTPNARAVVPLRPTR